MEEKNSTKLGRRNLSSPSLLRSEMYNVKMSKINTSVIEPPLQILKDPNIDPSYVAA